MDTKLLDHEDFFIFTKEEDECLDLLEELVSYIEQDFEITYTDLNPPQLPKVVTNQVREDDLNLKDAKEEENVSFVEEEQVKEVHRKARVGVRELRHSLCHGKRKF
ncbi:hypothetical protein Tco_1151134 [Tanacetum coccineum]